MAAWAADDEGPAVTIYSSADPAGFDPQQFIAQQREGYNPLYANQVPGFAVVKETVEKPIEVSELLGKIKRVIGG
jgi:hypothetical protein